MNFFDQNSAPAISGILAKSAFRANAVGLPFTYTDQENKTKHGSSKVKTKGLNQRHMLRYILILYKLVIIQRNAHYKSGKDIYLPLQALLIDLLISNNLSSMTFFPSCKVCPSYSAMNKNNSFGWL